MYTNKIVLITGSSRGVGLELARHFINNNATVIGISRQQNKNFEHSRYHHYSLDLSNPQSISDSFVKRSAEILKRLIL